MINKNTKKLQLIPRWIIDWFELNQSNKNLLNKVNETIIAKLINKNIRRIQIHYNHQFVE